MSNHIYMLDSKNLRDTLTENLSDEGEHVTNQEVQKTEEKPPEVQATNPEDEVKPFADKVDSKGKTPEELDEIYNNWNKSYTQKRQKEMAELKSYKEKLQEMETKLSTIEKKGNAIQDPNLHQEQKEVQKQFDMGNLSVEEYTKQMRELVKEDARAIAKEVFSEEFKQQDENTTQNAMLEKFNTVDGRFDNKFINPDSPEFNKTNAWLYQQVAAKMGEELQEHIDRTGTSKGFDVEKTATKHIKEIDGMIDAVLKSRVQASSQNVRARASEAQKSNPRGVASNSQTTEKKGIRELLEENVN